MIRGMYAAAAGMVTAFMRQQTVSNNLANLDTPGFKADMMPIRTGPVLGEVRPVNGLYNLPYATGDYRFNLGVVGTGSLTDPVVTDYSDGDVRVTGNELDVAIIGPGMFEMRSPDGDTFYTRAGQFSRDAAGRLVGPDGAFLMGDEGAIRVGQGKVSIAADGTVYSDGTEITQLKVMEFPTDTPMRKLGDNRFAPTDPNARPTFASELTVVQQGAIEGSNVDPTKATIEMMAAMRSYEAAQRMVQINDSILERAVNDIGRV